MKNHIQNVVEHGVERLFPDAFLKNRNWAYLLINSLKFDTVCFFVCQVKGCLKILRLSSRPLAFTWYKAFPKKRKDGTRMELVSLPHFLHYFWRKMFLLLNFINWPPGCDVMNFEISPIFLMKLFFYMTKKLKQKFKYLENEKSF